VNVKERESLLIALRHVGKSWHHCAEVLGRPKSELRKLSIQLRDAGRWRINGQPARGASKLGESGLPIGRPRVDSTAVNLRLPVDVALALREIAEVNDTRVGAVISEAMVRTEQVLGCVPRAVSLGPPKTNVNVHVSTAAHAAFVERQGSSVGVVVAAACVALLRELGYEVTA
jgi:hypothetical protein